MIARGRRRTFNVTRTDRIANFTIFGEPFGAKPRDESVR